MKIFNDSITLSKFSNDKKDEKLWTANLVKKSEKEPQKMLEESLFPSHSNDGKNKNEINQAKLKHQEDEDDGILEIRQKDQHSNKQNGKYDVLQKGFEENNHDSRFHDVEGIPLYTHDVLQKEKDRAKKNEEFYKKNKKRVGDKDVVSASISRELNDDDDDPAKVTNASLMEDIYIKKEDPKDYDYNKDHLGFDSSEIEEALSPQRQYKIKKNKKK